VVRGHRDRPAASCGADAELRRRYPDTEIPLLQADGELGGAGTSDAGELRHEQEAAESAVADAGPAAPAAVADRPAGAAELSGRDISAALEAARRAREVLAEREQQADAVFDSGDVMRRRDAAARREAAARRAAVRQDAAPSRHADLPELEEHGLEAGQ
jgi:hypothetical protein